jgi:hypothetical protein
VELNAQSLMLAKQGVEELKKADMGRHLEKLRTKINELYELENVAFQSLKYISEKF